MIFNIESFQFIKKCTFQGISTDSCWSRGQAWAIYGYILAFEATQDILFLDVAKNLALYFINNLPKDYIPYWDFNATINTGLEKDSFAAAIACSGLLTLSKYSNEEIFKNTAIKILESLSKNYMTKASSDGIIAHGCFHKPKKISVDESLIWDDYYFIESLMKYRVFEKF